MNSSEGLSAGDVLELFESLGGLLSERGLARQIYVGGGAAMLLRYGRLALTRDVDVASVDRVLAEAAQRIAEDRGLDREWLSAGMTAWAPPSDDSDEVIQYGGLTVTVAGPRPMLAMKLVAGRGRDVDDILRLCAHLGVTSAQEAVAVAVEVYGRDSVALGDIDDLGVFVDALFAHGVEEGFPRATAPDDGRCRSRLPQE